MTGASRRGRASASAVGYETIRYGGGRSHPRTGLGAVTPNLQGIFALFGPRERLKTPNIIVFAVGYDVFTVKNNREFVATIRDSLFRNRDKLRSEQGSLSAKI
jgi:hypothetical protein